MQRGNILRGALPCAQTVKRENIQPKKAPPAVMCAKPVCRENILRQALPCAQTVQQENIRSGEEQPCA